MILDDLEGHLPNAGLIKCNLTNICATFSMVLTDVVHHTGLLVTADTCSYCYAVVDKISTVLTCSCDTLIADLFYCTDDCVSAALLNRKVRKTHLKFAH